jgi:hypothetical protein
LHHQSHSPTKSFKGRFFHELGASNERPAHPVLSGAISNGLLDGFHSEFDLDDVTHQEATGLQGQVPVLVVLEQQTTMLSN